MSAEKESPPRAAPADPLQLQFVFHEKRGNGSGVVRVRRQTRKAAHKVPPPQEVFDAED